MRPDYAEALYNRGNTLQELKRFEEALASYDRALAVRPDYAEALYNRGNTLKELKRFEEALASYDRALTVRPDYAEALSNRGLTLHELKRFEEALASYDRALTVRPDYAEAHWNEALLRLLTGDFSRGWVKYEWRWKNESLASQSAISRNRFGSALMRLMARPSCFIASRDLEIRSSSAAMCHSSPQRGARVILEVQGHYSEL